LFLIDGPANGGDDLAHWLKGHVKEFLASLANLGLIEQLEDPLLSKSTIECLAFKNAVELCGCSREGLPIHFISADGARSASAANFVHPWAKCGVF
jgi:hypothetical protein